MKTKLIVIGLIAAVTACAQKEKKEVAATSTQKKLFLDVHDLGPGKVTAAAVADAHKKDLATQSEFGVSFIKY